MNSFFSVGELSKLQNISRQTLIFYDKIGLFQPAYVDPDNGYRYYSSSQLDALDTILLMKKMGLSLDEIRVYMQDYTADSSILAMKRQLSVLTSQIEELQMLKSRVEHRCAQLEHARDVREWGERVTLEQVKRRYLLTQAVEPPYTLEQTSLATKQCFVRAFREHIPVFFQIGAVIPYENLLSGRYTEATQVFLPIEKSRHTKDVTALPEGQCLVTYHVGDYPSIGRAYCRLMEYAQEHQMKIVSDAYELAINDYLSTGDEREYVTKILLYVEPQPDAGT